MKLGCAIKPVARKDEGHHGGGPRHAAATPLADSDSSAAWKFPHVLMCRLSSKAFKNGSPGQQEDREPHNSVHRCVVCSGALGSDVSSIFSSK